MMTTRNLLRHLLLVPALGFAVPSCQKTPAGDDNDNNNNNNNNAPAKMAEVPSDVASEADPRGATKTRPTSTLEPTPASGEPASYLVARGVGPGNSEGYPKFRIFSGNDREVYISYGPWLMRPRADGTLVRDPAWITGIDPVQRDPSAVELAIAWTVHSAGGRWPDGLFMSIQYTTPFRGDVYPNRTYRWMGEAWREVDTQRPRFTHYPERITPWVDDSVLAMRSFVPRYKKDYDEMGPPKAEEQAIATAIAKVKPLAVLRGLPKAPNLGETFSDMDSLASGQLVALASADAKVLHYDASTQATTERPLPLGQEASLEGIELVAPDRAYVFGGIYDGDADATTPYLARFDGSTWTAQKGPPCGDSIFDVSWAEASGLWAICKSNAELWVFPTGDLWRLTDGGWVEAEFPVRGAVTGVVADGPGGVWVTTTSAVFGPTRPTDVPTFGGFDEIATSVAEYAEPSKTPLACADYLEFFYTVLDGDPDGDHTQQLAKLAQATAESEGQVVLAVVELRGALTLALQIHGELERADVKKLQGAFGDALGETYCVVREPQRTLP